MTSYRWAFSILLALVSMVTLAHAQTDPIQLVWHALTTNSDGTPLTDLVGYKLYYGQASRDYSVVDVGN